VTAVGRCAAPGTKEEAASPPLTFDEKAAARQAGGRAARGYGAAPPASRLLRIASATALRAGLDPGDLCGPSGRRYGQAQPAPAQRRGASDGPLPGRTRNAIHYMNWRSIVRRNGEITRIRYEEVSTVLGEPRSLLHDRGQFQALFAPNWP